MDRLASMNAFAKVVESGGFSAASRRLNMSVAMVSNHVQSLEDRLGARLLNRTTRRMSLTEAGKAYYERCSQILTDVDEADLAAGEMQLKPRGTLRLNISPALAAVIDRLIATYIDQNDDVRVDMLASDRMVDLVDEGFDLAVRITPVAETNLVMRRLGSYRHVCCAAPSYFKKHGKPKVPTDLSGHNCMNYAYYPDGQQWRFTVNSRPQLVEISGNFRCNSSAALAGAAVLGQGVILLPRFLVASDLAAGRLVSVLDQFLPNKFEINAFYANRRHLAAKIRCFIDLLVDHFSVE